MVRSRKDKPVSMAKMYRHFAIATVALTAVVGILADSEAQRSVSDTLKQKAHDSRVENSGKARKARELIRRDPHADSGGSGFAPDHAISGVSAVSMAATNSSFLRLPPGAKDSKPVWEQLGLTEEEWFALPPEVRRSLAGTDDPMIVGTAEERREAMRKMSAASRSRARPDTSIAGNAVVLDEGSDY